MSMLTYCCKAWTLTQKEENKLLIIERKVVSNGECGNRSCGSEAQHHWTIYLFI